MCQNFCLNLKIKFLRKCSRHKQKSQRQNFLYEETNFLNFNSVLTKCPLFVANFRKNSVSKSSVINYWHVCDRSQRKCVRLTRIIFLCDLSQTFLLFIVMQECFVISCGKGCLCDGCLWLFTDKSQQRPKLITKKCQEIP